MHAGGQLIIIITIATNIKIILKLYDPIGRYQLGIVSKLCSILYSKTNLAYLRRS